MPTNLPNWLVTAVAGLLAVFLLLVSADRIYSLTTKINSKEGKNTITVSGEGKIMSAPDLATVSAGMTINGATAAEVQNQATERLNKLTAFLKGQGVEKEDITTSQFNLYPQQTYDPVVLDRGAPKITGYTATQQVTVKVKKVNESTEKLSAILAGLVENGANQINNLSFSFENPDEVQTKAREQAIANAKAKAEALAAASGVRLGKVISLNEGYGGMPVPMMGRGGEVALMAEDKAAAPDIQPGSQEISVIMNLVYEIK